MSVDKPEDLGGFKLITISIDSVLPDTRVLSEVLYAIETRTPYFVVKEVDVRVKISESQESRCLN